MSNDFQLNASERQETGKGAVRRMRHNNIIPGVVYGAGKAPVSISMNHDEANKMFQNEAAYSHILDLQIDGKKESVVLKSLQRHVYKPILMHIDFLRIKAKEALTMRVPLHFTHEDTAPGIKEGGLLSKQMNDIEIKCLPADLPEFIELSLENMAMDQTLHLSDIKMPKGVTLATDITEDNDQAVCAIHAPKAASATQEGSDEASDASDEQATGDAEDGSDAS